MVRMGTENEGPDGQLDLTSIKKLLNHKRSYKYVHRLCPYHNAWTGVVFPLAVKLGPFLYRRRGYRLILVIRPGQYLVGVMCGPQLAPAAKLENFKVETPNFKTFSLFVSHPKGYIKGTNMGGKLMGRVCVMPRLGI